MSIERTLRVGMGQTWSRAAGPTPTWTGPSAMIGRAAAARGCRLVVLPECLDLGWTDPSARDLARPIPGPHADRLAPRRHASTDIYVAAGLVERAGDRLYNAAVLIDPEGRILLHHRKINELDIAPRPLLDRRPAGRRRDRAGDDRLWPSARTTSELAGRSDTSWPAWGPS